MEKNCKDQPLLPRKNCLHEIIDRLVVYHNDYRRMTVEVRNLQEEFKIEMQRLQFPCDELRKVLCCKNYDKTEGESFMQRIAQINEVYNCFTKRIDDLNERIKKVLENSQVCMTALSVSKESMKKSHDRKVEDLKRLVVQSNDQKKIASYEKKICELQKLFAKEITYIKQADIHLQPFFDRLKEDSPQTYIQSDDLKAYEWLPTGKRFDEVNASASEIMIKMGRSLVQAFAQQHLQQPNDVKGFLASYLLNLERNQKLLKEKMNLLQPQPSEQVCYELIL